MYKWRAGRRQKPWLLVSLVNILKQMLLTLTTSQLIQCSSTIVPNSFTVTYYLKYIPHFHIHENAMRKVLVFKILFSVEAECEFSPYAEKDT